jgi:hypothetical protein
MLISLSKWLQFLKEKNFKQTIHPIRVEDGEDITYEKATTTLRMAVHFFSALLASDGHWPAENAGVLFFHPLSVRFFFFFYMFTQEEEGDSNSFGEIYNYYQKKKNYHFDYHIMK